jgi:hypothetical protein
MALDLPRQREGKVPAAIGPLGQLVDCRVILEEHHALIDSEASGCAQEELLAPPADDLLKAARDPEVPSWVGLDEVAGRVVAVGREQLGRRRSDVDDSPGIPAAPAR